LLASAFGVPTCSVRAQTPQKQVVLPLSLRQAGYYRQHPAELQQLRDRLSQAAQQFRPARSLPTGTAPAPGTWSNPTGTLPPVAIQNPILMTDGTVIATSSCTGSWYKLTPDVTGSYINGNWAPIASMPSGYGPLFLGSGVLPDGRVIVEGGEYNDPSQSGDCGNGAWTTLGALYDPVANTWQPISPPTGWTSIGDAAGIVLSNGTYMQTDCCDTAGSSGLSALFNESQCCGSSAWTVTGAGKLDRWDEEGIIQLQNGKSLVVDAHTNNACSNSAEVYDPNTGTFSATGSTVDQMPDCNNPTGSLSAELGPVVTRQDGTAIAFPGILCSDAANSNCSNQASGFVVIGKADVYNASAGTWATLATMPRIGTAPKNYYYSLADAPAAVLPNGNVLFAASPDYQAFVTPTHYFELDFNSGSITQVGDTADASSTGAYEQNFLLLPNGQVLAVSQSGNIQFYTPLGSSSPPAWAPLVTSAPSCASPGHTYALAGTQLNGLTEGSYYGDDVQAAVNFPIVKIVNNATGHVFYARTFNHSTRSIAPGTAVSTSFQVAANTEGGPSLLYDVGAGTPSSGTAITISSSCLVDPHDFNGDGRSDILWRDTSGNVAMWLMNAAAVQNSSGVGGASPGLWSIAGQRDFNGDGAADILWQDTSGNVAMWFMSGASVIGSAGVGRADPSVWSIAGTGDFNGDGKGDILWRDTSGDVALWEMNGSSIKQTCSIGNAPPSWSIVGTGDFNGDGNADILWHDTSGNVAIWFMNGCSIIRSSGVGNADPSVWSIAGTGDFNGDGMSDILWHDGSGDVALWTMNGASVVQSAGVGNANATVWSIAETGDFDGDGKSDILWHDVTGDVAIWMMNGPTVARSSGAGSANSAVWTIQGANAD
jgi:hypothetical protein